MVRVVKRGKVPSKVFHGTCNNCQSELEEHADKLDIQYDQREGGELAAVTCPVCNKATWLYPKEE